MEDIPIKAETQSVNDSWIKDQGWKIKDRQIPEETHKELLEESLKKYKKIWKDLSNK